MRDIPKPQCTNREDLERYCNEVAISSTQAKLLTSAYTSVRRSGLLDHSLGQKVFTSAYFLYKKWLEDPFASLAKRRPELFKGGHILDIGANIGYTAAVFARAIDPGCVVYAFEPEPFNFRLLERSIRSRHFNSRVVPVHSAVGQEVGRIDLWLNLRHHADHRIATGEVKSAAPTNEVISVPITSVDAFVAGQIPEARVAFIKVDVQGYETPVCLGMDRTLRSNNGAVIALEYAPDALRQLGFSGPALLQWFEDRGYRAYSLHKNGDIEPGLGSGLARGGYTDLLFAKRELA